MKLLLETGEVNLDTRILSRGDERTRLSRIEAALLHYLASRPKATIPREELYEHVWNYKEGLQTRTLDLAMSRLRKKVEQIPQEPVHLMTVYGSGYAFIPLGEESPELEAPTSLCADIPSNLPVEHTTFFGRQVELAKLTECCNEHQGVTTVLGAPGMGKTRLVKHWAMEQIRSGTYKSIWFCDLTETRTDLGVLQAVAGALNTPLAGTQNSLLVITRQIGYALAALQSPLVILDNVEQVVSFTAKAIEQWRALAPEVVFILTSQVPLGISMERRLPLDPFPITDLKLHSEDHPALRLFIDRAQTVNPKFTVHEDNIEDVVAIVQELDGLPLALELAASRTHLMSTNAIRQRLKKRFQLLRRHARAGTGRHETLQAALSWAWDLLNTTEQRVLAQCSVFLDGFDWEAVEEVISPEADLWVLDVVSELVERSLVRVEEIPGGGVRLSLLVSIAAFAQKKFEELEADFRRDTHRRHAQYYARLGSPHLVAQSAYEVEPSVRQQLRREWDNIIIALERCIANQWNKEAVTLWTAASVQFQTQGPIHLALQFLESLVRLETTPTLHAALLYQMAYFKEKVGAQAEASTLYQSALEGYRELGDSTRQAAVLYSLAELEMYAGHSDAARSAYKQALDISMELDDQGRRHALVLDGIGNLEMNLGQWDLARHYYERGNELERRSGHPATLSRNLANLGNWAMAQNQLEEAKEYLLEALALSQEAGVAYNEGGVRATLAQVYFKEGKSDLAEAELAWAIEMGDRVWPSLSGCSRGILALIRAQNGAFDDARSLIKTGLEQLQGADFFEHGKLLCKRAEVELLAGSIAAAERALQDAETHSLGPETDLGQEIQIIRERLDTMTSEST